MEKIISWFYNCIKKKYSKFQNEIKTKKQQYLFSFEILKNINDLFLNDSGLLSLFYGNMIYDPNTEYKIRIITSGINIFFIQELIVPPNRFRPENSSFGGDENYFHYQTSAYRKILALDNDIREITSKSKEDNVNILKEEDKTIKKEIKEKKEKEKEVKEKEFKDKEKDDKKKTETKKTEKKHVPPKKKPEEKKETKKISIESKKENNIKKHEEAKKNDLGS